MQTKATYKEKECKSCGKSFTPTRSTQVNCPDCLELNPWHREANAQKLERAHRRNLNTYYDIGIEVRESKCANCGKTIKYTAYKGEEKDPPSYCSAECRSMIHIQKTKCAQCGKPMLETDDVYDTHGHDWFCCPECKEADKWEKARKNGTVKICPHCGNEFIKKATFCSMKCYKEDLEKKKEETEKRQDERLKMLPPEKAERIRKRREEQKRRMVYAAERHEMAKGGK